MVYWGFLAALNRNPVPISNWGSGCPHSKPPGPQEVPRRERQKNRHVTCIYIYILYHYIRRPRLQQGERVRGGITSSKGQEVIRSSKGKKQENKKEEARSKKTRKKKQEARSNYRQQAARSKKQDARKQQAAGRQVRELVFLSIQKATSGRRLEDSSESQFSCRLRKQW